MAWLSDGESQEETKQVSKICLLRNNGGYAYYSLNAVEALICLPLTYWCWCFIVRLGQLHIDSGVWDFGLTYKATEVTAVFYAVSTGCSHILYGV